jgi:hypothetical protein
MCTKATQEFIEREGEQLLFVVVSGIAPPKGDLAIGKRDQAVVANSHTMGVAAEIAQHVLRDQLVDQLQAARSN